MTLDADLQNDPADIPRVARGARRRDVVSGVRRNRQDDWLRRVSSRIANGVRRSVLDDRVTDVGCSLKAYRAEYLRRIPVFTGFHRFLPALIRWTAAACARSTSPTGRACTAPASTASATGCGAAWPT